jgi:hypothetical protein
MKNVPENKTMKEPKSKGRHKSKYSSNKIKASRPNFLAKRHSSVRYSTNKTKEFGFYCLKERCQKNFNKEE